MNSSSKGPCQPPEPRFLADVMLGTLAKWLRILGFDTAYDNAIQDDQVIARCRLEGRIALTRDEPLTRRPELGDHVFIRDDELVDQIRQVLDYLGRRVDPERLFTRCLACNTPLREISRAGARSRVPPYVYQTQRRFRQCADCGRVYWPGTHREAVLERLERV